MIVNLSNLRYFEYHIQNSNTCPSLQCSYPFDDADLCSRFLSIKFKPLNSLYYKITKKLPFYVSGGKTLACSKRWQVLLLREGQSIHYQHHHPTRRPRKKGSKNLILVAHGKLRGDFFTPHQIIQKIIYNIPHTTVPSRLTGCSTLIIISPESIQNLS